MCDETQNSKDTDSESFFETDSETFFGTKFFWDLFRDFFSHLFRDRFLRLHFDTNFFRDWFRYHKKCSKIKNEVNWGKSRFIEINQSKHSIFLYYKLLGGVNYGFVVGSNQDLSPSLMHFSQVPWEPNFVQNGDPMVTQFWVRWGPNGDLRQHKWGPKKRYFENLSKRANSLIYGGENYGKTLSRSVASFGVQVYRLKLVLSSQVFKWSTFNR